jgi:hypothetical protein
VYILGELLKERNDEFELERFSHFFALFHATLKHCPFSSRSNDLFHTPLNLQADLILDVL